MNEKIDILSSKGEADLYLTNYLSIERLNNDCLRHIFQYLSIVDRIRVEAVCRRWQIISLESWNNLKMLNFENECWGFKKPKSIEKINSRILKKVLNRCGQYLLDIDFAGNTTRLGPNVLNVVARFCPSIQTICTNDLEVSPWSIRVLAESCSKIEYFSIGSCTGECDDELSLLFKNNRYIKEMCIFSNFDVTGECLLHLNSETIETIVFENCPSISMNYFSVVQEFRNLKVLIVEHYHDNNSKTIGNITSCAKTLQFLTLALCPFYSGSLCQIAQLTNLEALDLSSNAAVDDELLIAVGAHCKQLRRVDVSYCNVVTNAGVAGILTLPKLKTLFIEDLDNITDQVLCRSMPSIRQINCSYCPNLRDAGLIKLIESSHKMEHLYLNNCKNISNELLEAAIRVTKERKSKIVLKLHLSYTDIRLSEVKDFSPYLVVIPLIVVNCCTTLVNI